MNPGEDAGKGDLHSLLDEKLEIRVEKPQKAKTRSTI